MKLRKYVTYVWSLVMLVIAGFGIYYIITGENIITGQKKVEINVLSERDSNSEQTTQTKKNTDNQEEQEKEDNSEGNTELMFFNEVANVTTFDPELELNTINQNEGTEVIKFYFGHQEGNLYVTALATGLDEEQNYYGWLINTETGDYIKVGEIRRLQEGDSFRTAKIAEENSLENYNRAVVTINEEDPEEPTEANYAFQADIIPEEFVDTEEETQDQS